MFLANTSHELRTPLNAIIGFSSLIGNLAARGVSAEKLVDYSNTITASGEHLLALINDLLDMSKIEAGRFELDEQAVSLSDILDQLIDLVRLQAEQKAIRVVRDRAVSGAVVKGDPKALRQILLNLISNAVKFTNQGGKVTVSIQPVAGGALNILVADTGVGIAPDALERVFQPFERVRTVAAKTEGTGLGLSIARGLISLHGGNIVLESSIGKGTTAIVTIPASRVIAVQTAEKLLTVSQRTAPSVSA
jgi:signal transduction histidine kinase